MLLGREAIKRTIFYSILFYSSAVARSAFCPPAGRAGFLAQAKNAVSTLPQGRTHLPGAPQQYINANRPDQPAPHLPFL